MATFQFDFVGPERTLYSGQVDAVQLPGIEGEMTVLAGHAPVLTALKVGVITIAEAGHTGKRVLVRGGFADIGPDAVTVIAERANPFEEISQESLDRDIAALELQRDATEDYAKRDEIEGQITQIRDAKVALTY
ncbi:ATP synthase F1 subunit epsilon [Methylobacterium iners]|jgi:F-type H+-transporting ATPase subunit epsilon|uniref:ATP synthase epsilon chain n=1 Tax=Methylobacterium iners TaxID=418707 RepID=A0ABQ4RTU7_9HYPH|nr:ATP synthase F1 subunit epsilon [Methylobacterium iners]GJD94223.1 ATP synthase epsilon chain [Methylobacterium iners]